MIADQLPKDVREVFSEAQDGYVERLEPAWRGRVARRSGRYQDTIRFGRAVERAAVRERLGEAPGATGYSDVYERGRKDANYPGRYAVKKAVEASEGVMSAELDDAGRELQRRVSG